MDEIGTECNQQTRPAAAKRQISFYREATVREYRPEPGYLTSKLEGLIRSQRLKVQRLMERFQSTRNSVSMKYQTARAHTDAVADYLRSEPVFIERAAIISVAAITGLVIAYRKTALKKVGYTLAFGGTATAVCYPYQTVQYTSSAYDSVKRPTVRLYKEYAPWRGYDLASIPESKSKQPSTTQIEERQEAKNTKSEDLGQSTPEDKDMYSTREG